MGRIHGGSPWLQKVNDWSAGDLARVGFGECLGARPEDLYSGAERSGVFFWPTLALSGPSRWIGGLAAAAARKGEAHLKSQTKKLINNCGGEA